MPQHDELGHLSASLRTPRAAAIAGIFFALIFGTVLVVIRRAVPLDPGDTGRWLASRSKRDQVNVALSMLPFAGIAFLWFVGVMRDRLGAKEDRFFSTVLLGSGLIFVTLLFASGAVAASVLATGAGVRPDSELWAFGRRLSFTLITTYGLRMAAVFTITASTTAGRLGLLPRWLMALGYLTAALLLFAVNALPALELLFPLWVMAVSVHILLESWNRDAGDDAAEEGTAAEPMN